MVRETLEIIGLSSFVVSIVFSYPIPLLNNISDVHGNQERIMRNQTDYIMTDLEVKKNVKPLNTHPGADVKGDHNPVVSDFRMQRFKKLKHGTIK